MISLMKDLARKGHKLTITFKTCEDESGDMRCEMMCNDSPNIFGLALRFLDRDDSEDLIDPDSQDALIVQGLEALVRRAKELENQL